MNIEIKRQLDAFAGKRIKSLSMVGEGHFYIICTDGSLCQLIADEPVYDERADDMVGRMVVCFGSVGASE